MLRIYHNPRCSKSRAALALLEQAGKTPEVVKYLDEPIDEEGLRKLLKKLDIPATELLRTTEKEYRTLGLDRPGVDEKTAINALLTQPRLMQRPIVETENRALVARPPERVQDLL